jgi:hypothetical protein
VTDNRPAKTTESGFPRRKSAGDAATAAVGHGAEILVTGDPPIAFAAVTGEEPEADDRTPVAPRDSPAGLGRMA